MAAGGEVDRQLQQPAAVDRNWPDGADWQRPTINSRAVSGQRSKVIDSWTRRRHCSAVRTRMSWNHAHPCCDGPHVPGNLRNRMAGALLKSGSAAPLSSYRGAALSEAPLIAVTSAIEYLHSLHALGACGATLPPMARRGGITSAGTFGSRPLRADLQ